MAANNYEQRLDPFLPPDDISLVTLQHVNTAGPAAHDEPIVSTISNAQLTRRCVRGIFVDVGDDAGVGG